MVGLMQPPKPMTRPWVHPLHYQSTKISATYAPWMQDTDFQSIWTKLGRHTLVDQPRLYELYTLVRQASSRGTQALEVGVWRGGSAAVIQAALQHSAHPTALTLADTFTGVPKASEVYDSTYKGGEHANTSIDEVLELWQRFEWPSPTILSGIFPDDHPTFDMHDLAFVHIDVDTYDSAKDVFWWCAPRLVHGAIVVFDDYGFKSCDGVTHFVNDLRTHPTFGETYTFIHNLNGHGLVLKHGHDD